MHRVRLSLPYFRKFGWRPLVLAVAPGFVEGVNEALLLETIPEDVEVRRVSALSAKWTRKFGLGNLALRSLPFLYFEGNRILRSTKIDLVYFTTTAFPAPVLGRLWKRRFGTPFVIDFQDPWVTDYYAEHPEAAKPSKFWFADRLHRATEPWTMESVDGLIAVSADYIKTLRIRYPWLAEKPAITLPFAATEEDMRLARSRVFINQFFDSSDGNIHGVYVGRGGPDMKPALQVIFEAFRLGLEMEPQTFEKIHLHFIGTDYAPVHLGQKTVEPVARDFGISRRVHEHTARVPYFEALQLLLSASFLVVPGSDDPQYTASKIYPYILARKPLLAVFHPSSSVCDVLRGTGAGVPFAFSASPKDLLKHWSTLLRSSAALPEMNWAAFARYSAENMTARQCELFNDVVSPKTCVAAV